MRAVLVALALVPAAVHADDASAVRQAETPALVRGADETMLHLDPVVLPFLADLRAREERRSRPLFVGAHTWIELEGARWENALDVPERGWMVGLHAAHDVGWLRASVSARLHNIDSRQGGGAYYDLGLTIGTSKRLSRWMTAWIALTIGARTWSASRRPSKRTHSR